MQSVKSVAAFDGFGDWGREAGEIVPGPRQDRLAGLLAFPLQQSLNAAVHFPEPFLEAGQLLGRQDLREFG